MRAIALQIPSQLVGETRVVHCRCGATRNAPMGLKVISCVRCGAGMGSTVDMRRSIPPSRGLLALATFPSQVLGTLVFAFAVARIVLVGVDDMAIGALVVAAAWVFAGGAAHRGSSLALVLCAAFNTAAAIALLAPVSDIAAFMAPLLTKVSDQQFEMGRIVVAGIAVIAAIECFVGLPQARAFAKWRNDLVRTSPRFG
jgi:hypothetical protein